MPLFFKGSKEPTLGVEVEYQILDPQTCAAVPASERVLQLCKQKGLDRIKAEIHQSMLEVDTEIATDVKQCKRFLTERNKALREVFDELGLMVGATATHPFHHWSDNKVYPAERYLHVSEKFQWLAKRVTVYGMHVHVGVPNGDAALAVMRRAIPYLPYLLALSANSPYWQGIDTGMASCRIGIMDSFPYAGIPRRFDSWEEFTEYFRVLQRMDIVSSLKDFYWHIRPNAEFGTVEFRICDMTSTLDEALALIAFSQNLVYWILEDIQQNPSPGSDWRERYWVAPENHWMAERDGLNGMIIPQSGKGRIKIREDMERIIEMLTPVAKRLNNFEEFIFLREILNRGTGSDRQRAIYRETESFEEVIKAMNYEFLHNAPFPMSL